MEIDITRLFSEDSAFVPFDMSNNRATLGDECASLTWRAAIECARETVPPLLDTEERKAEFRDWVESSGGWEREEIDAWSDEELNALLLQWIAGDVREAFHDADFAEWDWEDYQERAERGSVSSNLFRSDDGSVFFSISN